MTAQLPEPVEAVLRGHERARAQLDHIIGMVGWIGHATVADDGWVAFTRWSTYLRVKPDRDGLRLELDLYQAGRTEPGLSELPRRGWYDTWLGPDAPIPDALRQHIREAADIGNIK